jgi:hypothetical protein
MEKELGRRAAFVGLLVAFKIIPVFSIAYGRFRIDGFGLFSATLGALLNAFTLISARETALFWGSPRVPTLCFQ